MKIMQGDEGKVVRSQAKVEVQPYANAIETPTQTHIKIRMWRHRGPPAMLSGSAPDYPGRRPDCIGHPHPAAALMHMPASIMKRSPAPGVVRLPVPAAIGINPVTG